jgi:hypothetical protein
MRKPLFFAATLSLFLLAGPPLAAQQTEGGGDADFFDRPVPRKYGKEFQFLAYYFNQGVVSNYYPTNDFLKGQVFGRLFGQNTTATSDSLTTRYFEQRLLPFFIFQPKLLDGKAILRASFEIDWTWGDASYTAGGNFGSAISADVVNIQTQNVELELIPKTGWAINLGLQRMYDTPYNPYRTLFDKMTNTGYRLAYWGTDGVGISVRRDRDFDRWKAGYYQLYENNIEENDDVTLWEFTYEKSLKKSWKWGGSLYYVMDRANGEGGPSILGQGLNATLNQYNGTYRFPLGGAPYRADIGWLGTYFSYNADYTYRRWFMTGFINSNIGNVRTLGTEGTYSTAANVLGAAANLRVGYRHGQTVNDLANIDLIFASGDGNEIEDELYTGVITGNTWGAPAGIFISHGAYIIFPHGNVVNRFVSLVSDLSNIGYGLAGGTVNYYKDIVPHRWNVKAGGAFAFSPYAPADGGNIIGAEINGRISYTPHILMNLELHGAYAALGDFFDDPDLNGGVSVRPPNPWTVFLAYKWLIF